MSRSLLLPLMTAWACDAQPSLDSTAAKAAVEAAFAEANPPGRTGLELAGKAVWLGTSAFDKSCLESKDLAFNDDPGSRPASSGPRISPTYAAQRYLTASTELGYCVYLGDTPVLTVEDASWGGDRYRVNIKVGMQKASLGLWAPFGSKSLPLPVPKTAPEK